MPRGLPPCPPNLCPFRLSATKGQRSGVTCHLHPSGGQPPSCHRPRPTDSSTLPPRVSRAPRRTAAGAGKDCGQVTPLPRGQTRGHLVPVTVHGQQTQQVEGMAALGEAAHGHWPNGLAVGHVAVARHHSQFLHTDDAVLEGDQHRARSLTARCATGRGGGPNRKRPSLPKHQDYGQSVLQSAGPKAGRQMHHQDLRHQRAHHSRGDDRRPQAQGRQGPEH